MTIQWPDDYLRPAKITRHLAPRTTAGTVSASGFTQRVSVPAHAWTISYDGIVIRDSADLRAWDSLAGLLDGGAVPILVPLLGEDTGGPDEGIIIDSVSAGATRISIGRSVPVWNGYHCQIAEHLYRVVSTYSVVGQTYDVQIRPPLRQNFAFGAQVFFFKPACKCRLATDDEMVLELDSARIGVGKVRFVEDPSV